MNHIRTALAILALLACLAWPPIAAMLRYLPLAWRDMRKDYAEWWRDFKRVVKYWRGE